jgi:hypothetical protein
VNDPFIRLSPGQIECAGFLPRLEQMNSLNGRVFSKEVMDIELERGRLTH